MGEPSRTLIISDGGLGAAVAVFHASERSGSEDRVLVWPADAGADASHSRARRRAMERSATLAGGLVLRSAAQGTGGVPGMLLAALDAAATENAAAVVWPASAGVPAEPFEADATQAADNAESAILSERLWAIQTGGSVRLETPFADLPDASVCELALDAGLRPEACWWWGGQDEEARVESERWLGAFACLGLTADRPAVEAPHGPVPARGPARGQAVVRGQGGRTGTRG
ncbi:MAG: hypothetical protein AAGF47_12395 [Planctomycetota bacterium]